MREFAVSVIIAQACFLVLPTRCEHGQRHGRGNSTEMTVGGIDLERIFAIFTETPKASIRFYLFTNTINGSEEIVIENLPRFRKSHFHPKNPVKILIHGYRKNGFSDFPHFVKGAYLNMEKERKSRNDRNLNVICVDWRRQANERIYLNSAYNTRMVGERVGAFILFLKDNGFIESFEAVHIVGFSLGAQVAGYAGKFVRMSRIQKVGRITGLDPAGPAFTGPDARNRLDSEDAEFVDVIHTSIWKSGIARPIGHVDFYPNSGESQPGCSFENVVDPFLGGCSHARSVELFVESILNVKLYGCKCGNWSQYEIGLCDCKNPANLALLGEYCDPSTRGNYFLKTESSPPFALDEDDAHPPYNTTAAFAVFINSVNISNPTI